MGERRRPSIIREPCDQNLPIYSETSNPSPSIACRFQRFFSVVTLDFLALAIRVANALRKLRYHQLCSPASLPTEWTQSGSLSSESSFRWFLSYVRTLLPTGKWRINRHATSPSIHPVANLPLISTWNIVLFSAKRATWCLLIDRTQYPLVLHYISVTWELDSSTTKGMGVVNIKYLIPYTYIFE